jgi:hypothetical protein
MIIEYTDQFFPNLDFGLKTNHLATLDKIKNATTESNKHTANTFAAEYLPRKWRSTSELPLLPVTKTRVPRFSNQSSKFG